MKMESEITLKKENPLPLIGNPLSKQDNKIFFSNQELVAVGCKNCVWQLHGQCPYGLKDGENYLSSEELINLDRVCISAEKGKPIMLKNGTGLNIPIDKVLSGICPDMINFLLSLADKNDTSSGAWEKFHIYKARLQESEDYKDYMQQIEKVKIQEEYFIKNPPSEKEQESFSQLKMNKASAKIWWMRLNQHVIMSLQRVVDRESKQKTSEMPKGIYVGKLNFNINEPLQGTHVPYQGTHKQIEEK